MQRAVVVDVSHTMDVPPETEFTAISYLENMSNAKRIISKPPINLRIGLIRIQLTSQ